MSLPGDITTITVTGTYRSATGTAAAGAVVFTPSSMLTDITGQVILTGAPINAPLIAGVFSVTLPCTDNVTIRPDGFKYLVNQAVGFTSAAQFAIALPSTLGPTVDISALAPIPIPALPTAGIYVSTVNGQSGAVAVPALASSAPAAGAIAETAPRFAVTSSTMALASGTLYLAQVLLAGGVQSAGWNWVSGSTGGTVLTHWWGCLLNSAYQVLAVTPDQGAATIAPSSVHPVTWGSAFSAPLSGVYWWGIMLAGSNLPTSTGTATAPGASITQALPVAGTSSTGQTTPPVLGQTMTAVTAATQVPYGFID